MLDGYRSNALLVKHYVCKISSHLGYVAESKNLEYVCMKLDASMCILFKDLISSKFWMDGAK